MTHIVFFKLKECTLENQQKVADILNKMQGKIDLVDENQAVLASKEVADSDCKTVGQAVMDFFVEKDIPIEQVVDVKVSLQEGMDANQSLAELKEVIPCPVHIG